MSEKYILLYDSDRDPVFLELITGQLSWVLPSNNSVRNLLFMTHLAENGQPYYENLKTNEVSWNLPTQEMSTAAISAAAYVQKNPCSSVEQKIGKPYSPDAATAQMAAIDDFLANQEQGIGNTGEGNDDAGQGSDDEIVRDSNSFENRPSRAAVMRTVQNIKSIRAKVIFSDIFHVSIVY